MSAFDRIEPRLPGLLAELAAARVPDYFDDMLGHTAGLRQRQGLQAVPTRVALGILDVGRLAAGPARPIAVLVIVALVLAATVVVVVGSLPRQLPPAFGPARNGALLMDTADGDIVSVDIETGATRVVVGGPTIDVLPMFTALGDRFFFVRRGLDGSEALFLAKDDGSDVREILPAGPRFAQISPTSSGDRVLVVRGTDPPSFEVVESSVGAAPPIHLGATFEAALWRPMRDELILELEVDGRPGLYLADGDGSVIRRIRTAGPIGGNVSISPDGQRLAYVSWEEGHPSNAQVRVVDIDGGQDRPVTPDGDDEWGLAGFSPDGTGLVAFRQVGERTLFQPVFLPIDGGDPRALGTRRHFGGIVEQSPDGKELLVNDADDGTTWLLGVADGTSRQLPWTPTGFLTWQRLAP